MPSESKKLPGVLMLLLSALGILICLLTAAGVAFSLTLPQSSLSAPLELLPVASTGALALLAGILQIPTLVLAINTLRGKISRIKHPSLFKPASIAGLAWIGVMLAGILALRAQAAWYLFVPLTLLAVVLPVWWLVEFSRRGLPRSTSFREWGALTIGLMAAPLFIMLVELTMLTVITVVVLVLLATQPALLDGLGALSRILDMGQGGIEQLEQLLFELARNPVIAAALFLMIGILAPFVEELFKPMAIWFLLKRPLKDDEGFSLGLISGGAFALLESAGLASQISLDTWGQAVALRAGTGLLHIGLSGLVGYGLVSNWNRGRFGHAILVLFVAAGLHGAWNSLALLSGFSAPSMPDAAAVDFQPTIGSILSVLGMVLVFGAVLVIVLRINKKLRLGLMNNAGLSASSDLPSTSSFGA